MASVSIVQPDVGKITGSYFGTGGITVTWSSTVLEDEFIGFKLYCHACNRTIQSSSSNPAYFNIEGLENSGHPGPFEITANALGAWTNVTIVTSVAEGSGTVSPETQTIRARRGSEITFRIRATPAEGWEFEKWTGWGESTSASVAITTTVEGMNPTYRFYAHFGKKPYTVRFASSLNSKEWIVGDFNSCQYLGKLVVGSGPSISVHSNNIDNPTTRPYEKLFLFSLSKSSFYIGDAITIRVNMLRADIYKAWGIKILGYKLKYPDHTEFIQGENVSFKAGRGNLSITPVVTACYGVKNFLLQIFSKEPKVDLNVKSGNSYSVATKLSDENGHIIGMTIVASPSAVIDIGSKPFDGDYHIHGYSHNLEDVTGESGYKWKRLIMPEESLTVTVYVCTDALVHGDQGDLLNTEENALAYGCFISEGQTVYP